jgi:hypothetical protein
MLIRSDAAVTISSMVVSTRYDGSIDVDSSTIDRPVEPDMTSRGEERGRQRSSQDVGVGIVSDDRRRSDGMDARHRRVHSCSADATSQSRWSRTGGVSTQRCSSSLTLLLPRVVVRRAWCVDDSVVCRSTSAPRNPTRRRPRTCTRCCALIAPAR